MDRLKLISRLFQLAVDVYKMTVKVNERVGVFKYEDSICDLLYHMKYMYVGDFVKSEAEQAIQRLCPSMREKLKYIYNTHMGSGDASSVITSLGNSSVNSLI